MRGTSTNRCPKPPNYNLSVTEKPGCCGCEPQVVWLFVGHKNASQYLTIQHVSTSGPQLIHHKTTRNLTILQIVSWGAASIAKWNHVRIPLIRRLRSIPLPTSPWARSAGRKFQRDGSWRVPRRCGY